MALKSTIFKTELSVSDMERNHYATHQLTIARHPSETDERMMLRIALFALHADERLTFGKGLSTDDEPDLWLTALSGEVEQWIDLGQPDEKRIRKACGRARGVYIYSYASRRAHIWWEQNRNGLSRFDNLSVYHFADEKVERLGGLVNKTMQLQVTIQDGVAWISDDTTAVELTLEQWK